MNLRPEPILYVECFCPCGWIGDMEVFEGLPTLPCPCCGSEELCRA